MIPPRAHRKRRTPRPPHPFDVLHGTDTGALIPGDDLATGHPHDRHITAYHGTAPSLFRKLLKRWQDDYQLHPLQKTAFMDIGAGKGRAMLLAAGYPFRRIVGVELHPALAAATYENLDHWQTLYPDAPKMTLVEDDVMRLRIPTGPCLFFLFNPFGFVLLDRFLTHLERIFADRPGELDLLYVNDEQRAVITEEHPKFTQLWRGRVHLSREDANADKATIAHDADGMYVTVGYEDCSIYRMTR